MQHVGKVEAFELGLHRRIVAGVDAGWAVAMRLVPRINAPQFGGQFSRPSPFGFLLLAKLTK
jgi:hypothetical protein